MSSEKLLNIEPRELKFRFELRKQASCTVRLSNNSRHPVFFQVITKSPEKYFFRPRYGTILPQSSRDVTVTVQGPREIPPNMQCKDILFIKNFAVRYGVRGKTSWKLLRVVYISPTYQDSSRSQSSISSPNLTSTKPCDLSPCTYPTGFVVPCSERSRAASPNASTLQERSLNHTELQDANGIHFGDLLKKGITFGLLGLIFWFLLMKMLPLIWSLAFMITTLIIKMTNKLVSDSVEDWVVKTLLCLVFHLFSVVSKRRWIGTNE